LILYISSLQFKDRHSANDMMETYSPRHCFTMHMSRADMAKIKEINRKKEKYQKYKNIS
jgi:hypothetical protein